MGKFLVIFTLFAMVVSTTASVAHAHIDVNSASEVIINIDADIGSDTTGDSEPASNSDCDMGCCGSCAHSHAMFNTNQTSDVLSFSTKKLVISNAGHFLSDLVYGFKRPPKV